MRSLKIRLELNNEQCTLAAKHAGTARYAYNWGLDQSKKAYEANEKRPTAIDLHKKWVVYKNTDITWAKKVSKCAPQQAFRNLDNAFQRSFKMKTVQLPKFKKKGTRDSFYLEGAIRTKENTVKLPVFGWVKCSEILPECDIKNVVVSRHSDHWFVSFKTSEIPEKIENIAEKPIVGVDLGIKTLATLSNGKIVANKRPYKTHKRQLKIAQRKASRRYKKGIKGKEQSKNYQKAKAKVAKIHYRIACIRKDTLHKLTTHLAKNHSEIVIEDLNIRGMSKNHKLASAILDGGFFEFKRQLVYKCEWYGSKLTVVDRFYPSSKTCSNCSEVKTELSLKDRIYECEHCGHVQDRDLNAAINLAKKAVSYTVSPCGVFTPTKSVSLGSMLKQEANTTLSKFG
jgi:putative transposase